MKGYNGFYRSFTGEETLPADQSIMIKQVKFTYSPPGTAFKIQVKTIKDQRKKQIQALHRKQYGRKQVIKSRKRFYRVFFF